MEEPGTRTRQAGPRQVALGRKVPDRVARVGAEGSAKRRVTLPQMPSKLGSASGWSWRPRRPVSRLWMNPSRSFFSQDTIDKFLADIKTFGRSSPGRSTIIFSTSSRNT